MSISDRTGARRSLGFDLKKAEVLDMLRENDPSGTGLLDWPAFNRLSAYTLSDRQ